MTISTRYLNQEAQEACITVRNQMIAQVGQSLVEQATHHLRVDMDIDDDDLGAFYQGVMWAVAQQQSGEPPTRTARTVMTMVGEKLV